MVHRFLSKTESNRNSEILKPVMQHMEFKKWEMTQMMLYAQAFASWNQW